MGLGVGELEAELEAHPDKMAAIEANPPITTTRSRGEGIVEMRISLRDTLRRLRDIALGSTLFPV